ncbi:hypothetical protein [Parasitella parasitica]|uniref:Uncharacterized protein n=1 Tax=Parasitella parasitica TaxID=35722 RepID=A0A0B7MVE9_9FUNG|nr:hypothetical protein [Parasitella parasitica]
MNSLQQYFEQQNDKEAASIVADVVALLPSNTSVVNWRNQGDIEANGKVDEIDEDGVLNNILLTKESEIATLKEVVSKWRSRALAAESNARSYYLDQLDLIRLQHEKDIRSMESRYKRKLNEKEDIILNLEEQVDYLVSCHSSRRSSHSFESNMEENQDDDEDMRSIASSIYDRNAEQQLILIESRPTIYSNENTASHNKELRSEAILDSIQDTMRAIEQELSNKAQNHLHRRSPSNGTYFSSATLIDPEESSMSDTKKIKKSAFSINRIFKKAFPKFYNKSNLKYSSNKSAHQQQHLFHDASFPRSSTDETLGVYSTTSTVTSEDPSVHMNFTTSLLNHQSQQTMIM